MQRDTNITNEIKYINFFMSVEGVGSSTLHKLEQRFQTFRRAYEASDLTGVVSDIIREKISHYKKIRDCDEAWQEVVSHNVKVVHLNDPHYPILLKEIYQPPRVIYVRGNTEILKSEKMFAVVGSRGMTYYGQESMQRILPELIMNDFHIVSGLAEGVDTAAHNITMRLGGKPIGIIAGSINAKDFPRRTKELMSEIIKHGGCIIAEFPPVPWTIQKFNFVMRNRLISGLAPGTLIVEARNRSGALITAQYALEQNRLVFAIPGPINEELSAGTNSLIKEGAILTRCAEDILQELPSFNDGKKEPVQTVLPQLNPDELLLYQLLQKGTKNFDDLMAESALQISSLQSVLTSLELQGIIIKDGHDSYRHI